MWLGSLPTLLLLWCRLAGAAPIRPLAWELPYARGATLKTNKRTNEKDVRVEVWFNRISVLIGRDT